MIKKKLVSLALASMMLMGTSAICFAEEAAPEQKVDPNATNMSATYPTVAAILPLLPVKPESLNDAKAVTAYIQAVDAYLKAAQVYIDGTTNDLNKIVEERNAAISNANTVVAEYNTFFEANTQKK